VLALQQFLRTGDRCVRRPELDDLLWARTAGQKTHDFLRQPGRPDPIPEPQTAFNDFGQVVAFGLQPLRQALGNLNRQLHALWLIAQPRSAQCRIILFGSYATGQARADSDVDLVVVMPFRGSSTDKVVEIRGRVEAPFPLDLLVWRPAEAGKRDSFTRSVLREGKVMYEGRDT